MDDDFENRKDKLQMQILVLWGKYSFIEKTYDVLNIWKNYAKKVQGKSLECGHFLAEEKPNEVIEEFKRFFK